MERLIVIKLRLLVMEGVTNAMAARGDAPGGH